MGLNQGLIPPLGQHGNEMNLANLGIGWQRAKLLNLSVIQHAIRYGIGLRAPAVLLCRWLLQNLLLSRSPSIVGFRVTLLLCSRPILVGFFFKPFLLIHFKLGFCR